MLTFLFVILLITVFWNILKLAVRATWGISKILFTVILIPLFLIGLVLKGLISIAFPILLVIGVLSLLGFND